MGGPNVNPKEYYNPHSWDLPMKVPLILGTPMQGLRFRGFVFSGESIEFPCLRVRLWGSLHWVQDRVRVAGQSVRLK